MLEAFDCVFGECRIAAFFGRELFFASFSGCPLDFPVFFAGAMKAFP
jgi:hypothetical protein